MYKKILSAVLATCMLATAGCGGFTRQTTESTPGTDIVTVLNMDDVEDGGYYILRENTYEKLYAQDANYELADVNSSSADPQRTLWYREDWSKVPTMYKGDKLIFKTTETLDEKFSIERFEYVGYTVGITGLQQTQSGRFSYSTDVNNRNINTSAKDAMELLKLPTSTVIIDRIGGAYLREGNISSGGCILGLERDKTYLAEVYAGSFMHQYKLKANNLALTSMEMYQSVDYDFMQSQILSINFPDYFNSGYYLVNNFGLVRYVNGTSYDSETDFNIPNVMPGEEVEETTDEGNGLEQKGESNASTSDTGKVDVQKQNINVKAPGTYIVTVTYKDTIDETNIPTAEFVGVDKTYQLEAEEGSSTLSREISLKAGDYELKVYDLNDRSYTYTITSAAQTFEAEDAEEETTEN